jgi:DUF1009 family protein
MLAAAGRTSGAQVFAVNLRGEADGDLQPPQVTEAITIALGALSTALKFLRTHEVEELLFCGGVTKARLFDLRPDPAALKLLTRLPQTGDDKVLRALTGFFEEAGIRVGAPIDWLPEAVVSAGPIAGKTPDAQAQADLKLGLEVARGIGDLEIGQTVVVCRGTVVAVEAIEGTDAMLERAGKLAKKGAVVVKAVKPQQDRRLDLPTVGPETLEAMAAAGLKTLGLQQGCIILDRAEFLTAAKRRKITVLGL